MICNRYLILKEGNSYSGDELKAEHVKGTLVSALKEGEEFVYREYTTPHRLISTGLKIQDIHFPAQSTNADLELVLDDDSKQLLITL